MGKLNKILPECHKSQKNILFHLTFSAVNLTFGLSNDFVAQLVEQQTLNLWVLSSSLSGVTFKKPFYVVGWFFCSLENYRLLSCSAKNNRLIMRWTASARHQPKALPIHRFLYDFHLYECLPYDTLQNG